VARGYRRRGGRARKGENRKHFAIRKSRNQFYGYSRHRDRPLTGVCSAKGGCQVLNRFETRPWRALRDLRLAPRGEVGKMEGVCWGGRFERCVSRGRKNRERRWAENLNSCRAGKPLLCARLNKKRSLHKSHHAKAAAQGLFLGRCGSATGTR